MKKKMDANKDMWPNLDQGSLGLFALFVDGTCRLRVQQAANETTTTTSHMQLQNDKSLLVA